MLVHVTMGQVTSDPHLLFSHFLKFSSNPISAIGIKVTVNFVHNSAPNYLASSGSLNSPHVRDRVGEGKGAPGLHLAHLYLTEIRAPVGRRFPAKLLLHGPFIDPGFSLSLFLTFTQLLLWWCRRLLIFTVAPVDRTKMNSSSNFATTVAFYMGNHTRICLSVLSLLGLFFFNKCMYILFIPLKLCVLFF